MALAAAPPPLATFDQDLEARKKTSYCTLQSSAIPHLPQAATSALQQQSAATSLRLDRRTPEASKIKMSSPRLLSPQCSLCSAHLSRSPPRRKNSYHVSAGARASNRYLFFLIFLADSRVCWFGWLVRAAAATGAASKQRQQASSSHKFSLYELEHVLRILDVWLNCIRLSFLSYSHSNFHLFLETATWLSWRYIQL